MLCCVIDLRSCTPAPVRGSLAVHDVFRLHGHLQAGQAPQTTWDTLAAAAAGRHDGRFARGRLARTRDSSALSSPRALDFPDAHADDIHAFFGSDGEAAGRALCLGLGSQSSASPARAQLTLLLGVCDALQIVSLSVLRVYEILSSLIRIAPGSYYTTPSSLPLTTIC
jgi:hypothetical protein